MVLQAPTSPTQLNSTKIRKDNLYTGDNGNQAVFMFPFHQDLSFHSDFV